MTKSLIHTQVKYHGIYISNYTQMVQKDIKIKDKNYGIHNYKLNANYIPNDILGPMWPAAITNVASKADQCHWTYTKVKQHE